MVQSTKMNSLIRGLWNIDVYVCFFNRLHEQFSPTLCIVVPPSPRLKIETTVLFWKLEPCYSPLWGKNQTTLSTHILHSWVFVKDIWSFVSHFEILCSIHILHILLDAIIYCDSQHRVRGKLLDPLWKKERKKKDPLVFFLKRFVHFVVVAASC